MSIIRTWRSTYQLFLPAFLTKGWDALTPEETSDGARVHYTLAMLTDAVLEHARQGLQARFPSLGPESALALTGDDRGFVRGRSESTASFARRLIGWRYPRGHRVRGSAFALLEQLSIYFDRLRMFTVDRRGNYHERGAETPGGDADESFSYSYPWTWDAAPGQARFWVFLDPNPVDGSVRAIQGAPDFGDPGLWGGEVGTPGYCVGLTGLAPEDFVAARRIVRGPRGWKPAGSRGEWLVILLDETDPQVPGVDATWEHWSEQVEVSAGYFVQSPTRYDGWRYVSLAPEKNNAYAGKDLYADATLMPDGSLYGGADFLWADTVTLPDGSEYAGADNFLDRVQLIDDGDHT